MTKVDSEYIKNIDIFGPMTDLAVEQILESPENSIEEYEISDYILKETEKAEHMYLILEGSVEILIRGGQSGRQVVADSREVPIATLHSGDIFGEQALFRNSDGKRNASVRASSKCKLFRIHKKYVDINIKRDMEMTMTQITMIDLPQDQEVRDILGSMRLFKSLNADEVSSFREWTEIIEVSIGEVIIREKDPGDSMYVVMEGELEVFVTAKDGTQKPVALLREGNYFGESALINDKSPRRSAGVRGRTSCRIIKIPKKYFRLAIKRDTALGKAVQMISSARQIKSAAAKKSDSS